MKNPTLTLLLITCSASLTAAEVDFQEISGLLNEGMAKLVDKELLPPDRLFGRDQQDATSELNEIIEESLFILGSEAYLQKRDDYRKIETALLAEQMLMANKVERRTFAPDQGVTLQTRMIPTKSLKNIVATTKGDYDLLIDVHRRNIDSFESDLLSMREDLSSVLADLGIILDLDEIEFLLSSKTGEDLISMSVAFENVKAVTEQLGQLTAQTGENIDYAKRYYGMFVVLHELLLHMQQKFIGETNNVILPQLDAFRAEAQDLISQTRTLIRSNPDNASLKANLKANELTVEAIDAYKAFVIEHRNRAVEAEAIIKKEARIARNTYDTVNLSSNVTLMIKNGIDTFQTLAAIQMPTVAPFENKDLEREFKKINVRLREGLAY